MSTKYPALTRSLLSASLALSIALSSAVPIYAATSTTTATSTATTAASSEAKLFLKEKFGITFTTSTITRGQFIQAVAGALKLEQPEELPAFTDLTETSPYYTAAAALHKQGILTSTTVNAEQKLTAASALYIAVKAAGLQELAHTYPQAKITAGLKKLNLPASSLGTAAAQELAAAVDTGLLPASQYKAIKGKGLTPQLAETLIVQILSFKGEYKHFIGNISDSTIYAQLNDAFKTSNIIQAPELQTIVDMALKNNLVTGYNLKDARFDANFTPSLSLTYGHSDLKHVIQLIGLLRSEGIDAKVQLEPKTSAFVFMKEWGEPPTKDTENYKVVQIENGNYITYAKEFDIAFEFNNAADKARFQPIILQYAKKDKADQPGLIYGSWFQPLYYSSTKLDEYEVITNNKITGSGYFYAQSFSLNDQSKDIVEGFRKLDPAVNIDSYTFWVDKPFHNYLNGEGL
ncbi:hypothetical protein [Paenibacillus sp. FSL H8-0537]|uniref:hypothetical protein n=1 Tax=Paenibacillus sp. FSL H8-0537 TaxID=2921399 RepID=UPI003100D22F